MVAPSVSVNKNMWYVFEFVKFMGGAAEKMVNPTPPPFIRIITFCTCVRRPIRLDKTARDGESVTQILASPQGATRSAPGSPTMMRRTILYMAGCVLFSTTLYMACCVLFSSQVTTRYHKISHNSCGAEVVAANSKAMILLPFVS